MTTSFQRNPMWYVIHHDEWLLTLILLFKITLILFNSGLMALPVGRSLVEGRFLTLSLQ